LNFDPETQAKKIYAQELIRQVEQLAQKGQIEKALAQFQLALGLDSSLKISADFWNTLCRNGSLDGYVNKVMNACEKAVEVAHPKDGYIRDSSALARALSGDIQGAIEDLKFAIENGDDEEFETERQAWLEALQQGKNPFTKEVLEGLR
jgi:tetratricopeptide (TPR) repeat protein